MINIFYIQQFRRPERMFGSGKWLGPAERSTMSQGLRIAVTVGSTHWLHPLPSALL